MHWWGGAIALLLMCVCVLQVERRSIFATRRDRWALLFFVWGFPFVVELVLIFALYVPQKPFGPQVTLLGQEHKRGLPILLFAGG